MIKKVDSAVYSIISVASKNELKGGYIENGIVENGVGYAENQYNEAELKGIKDILEEIKQKIISKKIVVPDKI